MGIRVHKVIGYGLTDVTGPDDRRFTRNLYDLAEELWETPWEEVLLRVAKIEKGLMCRGVSTFAYHRSWWKDGVHETTPFLSYDDEFGLKNVVLFTSPLYPSWHRHDETMDWMEETENFSQDSRVQVFQRPIYPFEGWMDKRTGNFVRVECNPLQSHGRDRDAPFSEKLVLPGHNGYKTWGEAYDNTVPVIPLDITLMCRAFTVFKSDSTLLQLRPMLYVYWG